MTLHRGGFGRFYTNDLNVEAFFVCLFVFWKVLCALEAFPYRNVIITSLKSFPAGTRTTPVFTTGHDSFALDLLMQSETHLLW